MNRRRRLLLAIVLAVLAAIGLSSGTVAQASAPPDSAPPPAGTATAIVVNEFIPENADLGDCISALPRPECGSTARGGWRQGLVFGVIAVGLVAIGVRVAIAIRRRDRATNTA